MVDNEISHIKIKYFSPKIILIFFRRLLLHDCEWRPSDVYLPAANRELRAVSSYLNVDPITGPDATKEKFKSSVENATVIHLGNIETLKDYNWNNDIHCNKIIGIMFCT